MPIPHAAAPVFLLFGLVCVAWAAIAFRSQRRFLRKALRANGVVEKVNVERMDRGGTVYFPVIAFTTSAGAPISAPSKSGRNRPYVVGQPISVLYDPDDPRSLEIDAFWSRWLVVIAATFVAVVFFTIGFGVFVSPATRPPAPVGAFLDAVHSIKA